LEAARLRGWDTIPAIFVPVTSPAQVLLAAARENRAHGLPLTRGERCAVVKDLLRLGATLSDRALASACGVTRTTVAALRAEGRPRSGGVNTCSVGESDRPRLGQDNKHYPGASRHLGRAAESIVRLEPAITVRALAQRLGASVGSAHRYRADTLAHLRDERPWVRFLRRLMARLWLWRRRRRPA
jgi:ParB-like chromosome segregation protein Spo0J